MNSSVFKSVVEEMQHYFDSGNGYVLEYYVGIFSSH